MPILIAHEHSLRYHRTLPSHRRGRNLSAIGIGLGEDTGVVITNVDMLETIGSGQVMIFDGHEITYSDYADVEEGDPFSIEGMKVHIISKGHSYSVAQRQFAAVKVPVKG